MMMLSTESIRSGAPSISTEKYRPSRVVSDGIEREPWRAMLIPLLNVTYPPAADAPTLPITQRSDPVAGDAIESDPTVTVNSGRLFPPLVDARLANPMAHL